MNLPRSIEINPEAGGAITIVLFSPAEPGGAVTFANRNLAYRALNPLLRGEWLRPHGSC